MLDRRSVATSADAFNASVTCRRDEDLKLQSDADLQPPARFGMVSKGHVVRLFRLQDRYADVEIVGFNVEIDRQLYDVTGLV